MFDIGITSTKISYTKQARFFNGDPASDRVGKVRSLRDWSVAEISEFPEDALAFNFEMRVEVEVLFVDGTTNFVSERIKSSKSFHIKRDFAEGIGLDFEIVPVHPDLKDKIRVITRKSREVEPHKAAA